jgi:hypothetical protein
MVPMLSTTAHEVLEDFHWLATDLTRRPNHILEVIPSILPLTLGTQYAAKTGMGGVHFTPLLDGTIEPTMWRAPFVLSTPAKIISLPDPKVTITKSDLELAASVATHGVLAQRYDVREATIHNSSNNMDTLWSQQKHATTYSCPTARTHRLQSLHQRHCRYVPTFDYITGEANTMAHACSQMWHFSDSQLVTYFEFHFPQIRYWQLLPLCKRMHCALNLALSASRSRQELQTSMSEPWISIDHIETNSAWYIVLTLTSETGRTPCPSSKSLENATAMDACPPARGPFNLTQWRT